MSLKNLAKLIAESNREKTPEQEFLFLLNEATVRLEKRRQPSKTFKPSSLGGCLRRVYFEVTGAEIDDNQQVDPNLVGIAQSGTDRHERIQKTIAQMKDLGYDVEWIDVEEYLKRRPQPGTEVVEKKGMETKLRNTILNLSFMCDGIIKFKGKYYVLEIKTEVSFKWNGRVQVEDKHKTQATCYSVALGIDDILFIYENRDFCSKKTFHVQITNQDKEERVIHRIETVNAHIEDGTVPDKTTTQSECKYCPFTNVCKKY